MVSNSLVFVVFFAPQIPHKVPRAMWGIWGCLGGAGIGGLIGCLEVHPCLQAVGQSGPGPRNINKGRFACAKFDD